MNKASRVRVFRAVAMAQPEAYGNVIQDIANADILENWFTLCWPILNLFRVVSAGSLYVHLDRLERDGLLRSEWSAETFPERGNRRRRYYFLTAAGVEKLEWLDSES
jgi:hypothetical protein